MKAANEEQAMRCRILGHFLKSAREKAGFTQHEVAKRLSYTSPQFISNWERGISSPPLDVLPRLSTLLRISPKSLIETLHKYQDELLKLQRQELNEIFRKKSVGRG